MCSSQYREQTRGLERNKSMSNCAHLRFCLWSTSDAIASSLNWNFCLLDPYHARVARPSIGKQLVWNLFRSVKMEVLCSEQSANGEWRMFDFSVLTILLPQKNSSNLTQRCNWLYELHKAPELPICTGCTSIASGSFPLSVPYDTSHYNSRRRMTSCEANMLQVLLGRLWKTGLSGFSSLRTRLSGSPAPTLHVHSLRIFPGWPFPTLSAHR
jgi:hypothetical protein